MAADDALIQAMRKSCGWLSSNECFITVDCISGVRQGYVLAPALFCREMDFIMNHVSPKVGIQVGQHFYTDIDYAADVTLFIDQQEKYPIALSAMVKRPRSSVSMFPGAKRRSRILAAGLHHLL